MAHFHDAYKHASELERSRMRDEMAYEVTQTILRDSNLRFQLAGGLALDSSCDKLTETAYRVVDALIRRGCTSGQ
jgi:hypothetical protein